VGKSITRTWAPWAIAVLLADIVAIGAGMGVPIFAILLGGGIGWLLPARFAPANDTRRLLRFSLMAGGLLSLGTFLIMLAIWGTMLRMLSAPEAELANFGIPMILFTPKASFVGWFLLMTVVSPGLQWLMAGFFSAARIAWAPPRG
jgi:hypothetical protein